MLSAQEAHKRASILKESLGVPKKFQKYYGKFSNLLVRMYFQKKNREDGDTSRDVAGFIFLDLKNHGQIVPLTWITLEARSPREFAEATTQIVENEKAVEYVFGCIKKEAHPLGIQASKLPKIIEATPKKASQTTIRKSSTPQIKPVDRTVKVVLRYPPKNLQQTFLFKGKTPTQAKNSGLSAFRQIIRDAVAGTRIQKAQIRVSCRKIVPA
ncbi:hypothetical protein ACFL16_00470 [Patescibacteria group bacterium]